MKVIAKKSWIIVALMLLPIAAFGADKKRPAADSPEFPNYVMERLDDLYRGESSEATMTMEVKSAHWHRTMKLQSWSYGTEYSLIRILKPKKERGTATLKAGNDLFTYLSKTERTIKITSGMMGGSWMGSHFTNDDLVRESRMSEDFKISLEKSTKEGKETIHHFALIPNEDAAIVWGKIVVSFRDSDLMPVKQVYYDEDMVAVREMIFSDIKTVGGRTMPMVMTIKPLDEPDEFTRIEWVKINFDPKIDKSFFSLSNLKSL